MRPATALLVGALIIGCAPAKATDRFPDWIGPDKLKLLESLGIDPAADVAQHGNYYWRWRAAHELHIGGYTCPAGSVIEVSRTITLVLSQSACQGPNGARANQLKVEEDGSAEPLGGGE